MPEDRLTSNESAVSWPLKHAALSVAQQQRLSRLREAHEEIEALASGPGGTLEATVKLTGGTQYIFHEDPDKLLDRIEEVLSAGPHTP